MELLLQNDNVYLWYIDLFNDGVLFAIEGPETLHTVFGNPAWRVVQGRLEAGSIIAKGSFLYKAPGTATVYLMDTGTWTAYPIASEIALSYYQLQGTIFPDTTATSDALLSGWITGTLTNAPSVGNPIKPPGSS